MAKKIRKYFRRLGENRTLLLGVVFLAMFCRHIVDFLLSINVCTETVAGRSLFTCKNKRTVLIHFNREGAGVNRVSVCTNQFTETI